MGGQDISWTSIDSIMKSYDTATQKKVLTNYIRDLLTVVKSCRKMEGEKKMDYYFQNFQELVPYSSSSDDLINTYIESSIRKPENLDKENSKTDEVDKSNNKYGHICFLQYTSGSTSEPKGVVITHQALTHNLGLITTELRASTSTIVVGWLPQYHDMGLIGSYLGLLYCGGKGYYMSPFTFIRNPCLWILAMSKSRHTYSSTKFCLPAYR